MRWAEPDRLHLLWLLVPLLLSLIVAARRRRRLEESLGDPAALRRLTGDPGPGSRRLRGTLLLFAAAAAVLALARPQAGFRLVTTTSRGADVVIALDLSRSMAARDTRPDRLRAAQREAAALTEALEGSAMGLTVFAGEARIVSPLTTDEEGLLSMIQTTRSGDVEKPGSDLASGLELSAKLLHRPGERPRAIVLLSDGEQLQGEASSAIRGIRDAGARLHTIGIGTLAGGPIPVVDSLGVIRGEKRGPDGFPIRTRLDESALRDLARRGGGRYEAGDGSGRAAIRIADAIRSGGGEEVRGRTIRAYEERFPWLAALAGLLLLAERAVPRRRKQ
jgi:Ca-activated chloride channel family protein